MQLFSVKVYLLPIYLFLFNLWLLMGGAVSDQGVSVTKQNNMSRNLKNSRITGWNSILNIQ